MRALFSREILIGKNRFVRKSIMVLLILPVILLIACGSNSSVQTAVDGRQTIISTDDISIHAIGFSTDSVNRKIVQFEIDNNSRDDIVIWIKDVVLDGKNIRYNSSVTDVAAENHKEYSWKLFSSDMFEYDKDLFPNLKSFQISMSVKTLDGREIASVKNLSLDFNNLGSSR